MADEKTPEVTEDGRVHTEAPAEGGAQGRPEQERAHSEEPAEGSDTKA